MEAFFGSHTAEEAERLMLGSRRAVQPHLHVRDGGARPALPGARELHRVEELLRRRVDPRCERGAAHEEQPGADLARHAAGRADNEDILEELGATPDDVASLYDEQLLKKENGPSRKRGTG